MTLKHLPTFDSATAIRAVMESFRKLDPRVQLRNPVMFTVWVGGALSIVLWLHAMLTSAGEEPAWFILTVSTWLWLTVLFANFAEALAEGRGKAQADALRRTRTETLAKLLLEPRRGSPYETIGASYLKPNAVFLAEAGDIIPADGVVIEGVASVDESAITGESAPVIRESGGDRNSVTGGTKVLSDWLLVRVTTRPGESFMDRMIAMVEGAKRQRTPNEIALSILLAGLTIIFLLATATLLPFSVFSAAVSESRGATPVTVTTLVALLVCLIPTTIGALVSAIGIAGMQRLSGANVIAMSGRAVEAAGDVDIVLLDKTGTITLGNRQATAFLPAEGVTPDEL
ncbi:MAG TPA: HAD-IC family P-type ATPase, partial [Pirellulales bacterium]